MCLVCIFVGVNNINLTKKQMQLLIKLLDGAKKITDLREIIKNYPSLQKEIMTLEAEGYVKREEKIERQRVVYVSLTDKGRAVAEKLKEVEWTAKLSPEDLERFKNMRALLHVNIYEDHVTIMDIHLGKSRIANVYARLKGDKVFFWCDLCEDTDCYHIEYMFADYKLSDFIRSWINKNGYKLSKKYEKYVEKYW